jgi:polyhydroxybutyrate depolymerase
VLSAGALVLGLLAGASGSGSAAAAQSSRSGAPATTANSPSRGCAKHHTTPQSGVAQTIVSGGITRTYELTIPVTYTGKIPYALVFGLHPLSVSYQFMPSEVSFSKYQEMYRFIGVAPSGLTMPAPFWDAAPTTPNYDVDFISELLTHLEDNLCIDTSQVFSTGISNGAQMSSLLGCRLSTRISAIAPVEGEEYLVPCTGRPEPILAFHGTADPVLPYTGGGLNATTIARLYAWHGVIPPDMPAPLGIDASMRLWAKHNGCNPKPLQIRIAFDVQRRTWTGCKAATVLYIIDGGGHGWPGKPVPSMERQFGHDTTSIDASKLLFAFFFDRTRHSTGVSSRRSLH